MACMPTGFKARSAPRCSLTSPQARSAPRPRPTREVEQEPRDYGEATANGGTREPRVGGPADSEALRAAVSSEAPQSRCFSSGRHSRSALRSLSTVIPDPLEGTLRRLTERPTGVVVHGPGLAGPSPGVPRECHPDKAFLHLLASLARPPVPGDDR